METHRFALHEGHDTVTAESRAFTLSIVLGATLVALGVAAYVLSDFASITAFIPAIFGALLALLGVVGQRRTERRLAAYGIGLLAVLGVLGSTRGIPDIIALVTGGAVESTIAAVSQGAMILVCLVLLVAVLQFVRETRTAATP
jgi:hypothetical protein